MMPRVLSFSWFPSLIPIGHERESVRRVPVVTLGIIGICVVVHLLSPFAAMPTAREQLDINDAFERIVGFWNEHPSLEAPAWADSFIEQLTAEQQEQLDSFPRLSDEPLSDPARADLESQFVTLWSELGDAIPQSLQSVWGYHTREPSAIRAISSMFVHADWGHLFGNMIFLFVSAVLLEDVWGRGVFAAFYLLAGLASLFPDVLPLSDQDYVTYGASGAISGVMGAFAVRFWNVRMRILVGWGILAKPVWIRSWLILAFWFVQDIASIPAQFAGSGIASTSHVAGFAFGVLFALGMRFFAVEERGLAAAVEAKSRTTLVSNPHIDRSIDDLERGRSWVALRRLEDEARKSPDNVDTAIALWNVSCDLGVERDAAGTMARAIRREALSGDLDNATDHWRELVERVPTATMDATSLIGIAERLCRRGFRLEAADALRRAIEPAAAAESCATLLRIALAAADLEPTITVAAAEAALARSDSDQDERDRAMRLIDAARRRPVPLSY